MNTRVILAALWAFALLHLSVLALDPTSYEEISLLLRVGESPKFILAEVQKRKLVRPLTVDQLKALQALGASDALRKELQRPDHIASAAAVSAMELRNSQLREEVTETRLSPKQANQEPTKVPARLGDKDLIIEKLVILKDPLRQPFYVSFKASANAGRTEASFNIPGRKFIREGIDSKVEIPVNLVLRGVRENDWATVVLHLDINEQAVMTSNALKRHTARIPITDKAIFNEPFFFNPPQAKFIVSLNDNQEFVYQVFWKIQ